MPTLILDPHHPDAAAIEQAAAVLRRGGLVAFPTETVYGLGANALEPAAVARIFAAKGRPAYNPLIVHVADVAGAQRVAAQWPAAAQSLADRFWPGPVTMVLPKRPAVPDGVTAGLPSVAVRMPSHPVALALLRASGLPVAAPSANRFTAVSPTTARHVEKALGHRVDLILDGGACQVGIESTVVDLTGARPVLLRPGQVTLPELEAVLGPVELAKPSPAPDAPRASPGMLDRHYAPRARVLLYDTGDDAAALLREAPAGAAAALTLTTSVPGCAEMVRMPPDPLEYGRELYAALHRLDELGCGFIIIEMPPDEPAWAGVRDRLKRAGG